MKQTSSTNSNNHNKHLIKIKQAKSYNIYNVYKQPNNTIKLIILTTTNNQTLTHKQQALTHKSKHKQFIRNSKQTTTHMQNPNIQQYIPQYTQLPAKQSLKPTPSLE